MWNEWLENDVEWGREHMRITSWNEIAWWKYWMTCWSSWWCVVWICVDIKWQDASSISVISISQSYIKNISSLVFLHWIHEPLCNSAAAGVHKVRCCWCCCVNRVLYSVISHRLSFPIVLSVIGIYIVERISWLTIDIDNHKRKNE